MLQPYDQLIPAQLEENDINILPIELIHLTTVVGLPFYHRDPFDRLMIAQAITEDLPIVSPDSQLSQYAIKLIW